MKILTKSIIVAIALSFPIGSLFASSHFDQAIKARKAEMQLRAFNLGQLGAMAKGAVEYNADVAKAAAHNLKLLSSLDGSAMWPPGSDNGAMGDKTTALPALWANFPKVMESVNMLRSASDTLAEAAGKDLASLRGAMGEVGKACGSCHKQFRAEKK